MNKIFAHILSLFDAGGRRRMLGLLFLILGGRCWRRLATTTTTLKTPGFAGGWLFRH